MSPTAPPQQHKYNQASPKSPSPKVAFETLLGDAFLLREQSKIVTAKTMAAIDLLVLGIDPQKKV